MTESRFAMYKTFASSLDGEYGAGYIRGLSRHFHGDTFGSTDEHEALMSLGERHQERGDGYRDGFSGKPPRGMHGNTGKTNAKKDVVASAHVHIRCTTEEKNRAVKAAQSRGMKLSAYILSLIEEDLNK